MSDVEKYGLFAVVLVGGLLLIIAVSGGFSGSTPQPELPAATAASSPVVLDQPATLRAPDGQARGLQTVHVPPLLPTDNSKPFDFSEPPVAYPGERSSASPVAPPAPAPAAAQVQPDVAAASGGSATYVVREGDTLADIAQRQLGSSKRWADLVKLNPGLDPRHLKIGTTIRLGGSAPAASLASASQAVASPVVAAPANAAPAAKSAAKPSASSRTHTVASGDTLGAIAKKYLGSTARANEIFEANRSVLKSPDALKIGQVLQIP